MKGCLMRSLIGVLLVAVLVTARTGLAETVPPLKPKVAPVLDFKMKGLDGKMVDLSKYQGQVVMIVNVASECGLTKQYTGLQKLHDRYAKDGLVVLGVPANEFGGQEPGTDKEIATFCKTNYNVKFPMLSKVVVKGKDICPLYQHLTSKTTNPKFGGPISWNFAKFLIARDGTIVNRFAPGVDPEAAAVTKAIEAELKKK
jgi:glutathione peroxidase